MNEANVRRIVREELRHHRLIEDTKREMDLMDPHTADRFLEALSKDAGKADFSQSFPRKEAGEP